MAESYVDPGGIQVDVHVSDGLPELYGDPHQLRQVFTNLLTNAFEALGGRGRVAVTTWLGDVEDDRGPLGDTPETRPMLIEVSDDGPGVPPDVTDRIFSPFFSTKPSGSGFGLAIVRKIVHAHEGGIDVTSRPGGGTRFRMTLPVADDSQPHTLYAADERMVRPTSNPGRE